MSWISYSNYKSPVTSVIVVHRKLGSELFKSSAYGSAACWILWQITIIDIYFIYHLQERETNFLQIIMWGSRALLMKSSMQFKNDHDRYQRYKTIAMRILWTCNDKNIIRQLRERNLKYTSNLKQQSSQHVGKQVKFSKRRVGRKGKQGKITMTPVVEGCGAVK